jgi:hypothetical protein
VSPSIVGVPGHPYSMVVVQDHAIHVPHRPFKMALGVLGDRLHRRGGPPNGVVLLTPAWTRTGDGVNLMSLGPDGATHSERRRPSGGGPPPRLAPSQQPTATP